VGSAVPDRPVADDRGDRTDAIGERRRAGLQDHRRLDLVEFAVAHRGDGVPARTRGDPGRLELLPAPRPQDDVRRAAHDLAGVLEDALPGKRFGRALGEDIVAPGNAHQLGDPADAGDRRVVPLLEIDFRPARQPRGGVGNAIQAALQVVGVGGGAFVRAHQCTEPADVVEDAVDAAVVADPHLDTVADELGGDVGLDVGKADHEVRLELEDLADLRAGEGADLRLLLAGDRRPYGEAADADDAVLLAEGVQGFGRLLGQADDAPRSGHGYSIRLDQTPATSLS